MAGRIHYENKKYLNAQKVALMNNKTLENKDLAQRLGVSYSMIKRYLAGLSPIPIDLFYMKACEDEYIAVYFRAFCMEISGG